MNRICEAWDTERCRWKGCGKEGDCPHSIPHKEMKICTFGETDDYGCPICTPCEEFILEEDFRL